MPVACVFYDIENKKVVCDSHNWTNKTKNATTHAEMNCIDYLTNQLNYTKDDFKRLVVIVSCEPCIMCGYALALISKS